MGNPPEGGPQAVRWTANTLSQLRPGGRWFVPRSVSTVLVVSCSPSVAHAHTIFPDPRLVETLRLAGWSVHHSNAMER